MKPCAYTRRRFLAGGLALGAAASLGADAPDDLAGLAREIGWLPGAPDRFFFLQATDLHASELTSGALKMPDKFGGRNFVDDMNTLRPAPAFVALTGDLIAATSRQPATWPQAEAGFRRVNDLIVARLAMPCHMIVGNNDCSPEAFHKVWPDRPLTWSFDCHRLHAVGLYGYHTWRPENTNHAGILLDDAQLAWLARDLAAASGARTLALFTHEPLKDPDSHRIRRQLAPVLGAFPGEIWNIAGHNHGNAECVVRIGGKPVRVVETITPVGAWTPDKGAYRLFFVSDGRIVGTGLRWLTKDGEPLRFEAMPSGRMPAERIPVETALADGALRAFMVGEDEAALRQDVAQVTDRVSNLQFRKGAAATYRVPLSARGGTAAARLRLACSARLNAAFSPDGATWQTAEELVHAAGFATCRVPAALRDAQTLHIRLEAPPDQSVQLYGLAFLPA